MLLFNPAFVSSPRYPCCPPQAFSRTSAVLRNLSHSRLSLFSPALSRPLVYYRYPPRSTEHIPPVSHLSYATDLVTLSLSLQSFRRFRQESTLSPRHLSFPSYPLTLILSLFIFVVVLYIHVTNRSIKPHRSSAPREGVLS